MNNQTMEKYKSKYTENVVGAAHDMGAPAWSVVDNKGNVLAVFKMTTEFDGEAKANLLADEMNTVYAKRNYDKCCESVYAFRAIVECLEHWSDTVYKKVHCFTFEDPMPCFSVTDALDKMHELFKQAEKAINSIPPAKDVEKAIKEHKTNE